MIGSINSHSGWPANSVRIGRVDPYVKLNTFLDGVKYACEKMGITTEDLDKLNDKEHHGN